MSFERVLLLVNFVALLGLMIQVVLLQRRINHADRILRQVINNTALPHYLRVLIREYLRLPLPGGYHIEESEDEEEE